MWSLPDCKFYIRKMQWIARRDLLFHRPLLTCHGMKSKSTGVTDRIDDDPETEADKWNPADITYYFHMGLGAVICQNVFCKNLNLWDSNSESGHTNNRVDNRHKLYVLSWWGLIVISDTDLEISWGQSKQAHKGRFEQKPCMFRVSLWVIVCRWKKCI